MNLVTHDPELARQTRLRLWAEHLELPDQPDSRRPNEAIDELWKPISTEQLARRNAASHSPTDSSGFHTSPNAPAAPSARSAASSSTAGSYATRMRMCS